MPGIPVRLLDIDEEEETNASVAYKPSKTEAIGGELVDMMKTMNQSISFIVANQANPGVNPHFPTMNTQVFERIEAERRALEAHATENAKRMASVAAGNALQEKTEEHRNKRVKNKIG